MDLTLFLDHPGFFFLLGLVIGSFLNVVIHRLPQKGASLMHPPSTCPKCQKKIRWYDNVPVMSFLILRARCRHCRQPISWEYPLVELLCAFLLMAVYLRVGWGWELFVHHIPFVCILLAVVFIDLHLRIIPDQLSLGGLVLGLATGWAISDLGWQASLSGAAFGFFIFFGFSWAYYKWSGKIGLGGGDIKLLAMIGAFLGVSGVIHTMFISSITGSIIGLGYGLLFKREKVMGLAIPYGPFLVIGALVYYFFEDAYLTSIGLRGF